MNLAFKIAGKTLLIRKFSILFLFLFFLGNSYAQQSYGISICSGTAFSFTEPGAQAGQTYTWTVPIISPAGGITNGAALSNQNAVAQTLVNNTNTSVVTATYSVTTSLGTTFLLVVTVNPVPIVANSTAIICSANAFNTIPSNVPSNTTYTWANPTVNPIGAITGTLAQASPQIFIGQTLTNPTVNPATVIYTVTPKSGTCTGNPFLITVTVNPLPVLNNSNTATTAMCSGSTFSFLPLSSTTGTTINWSRIAVTGISNTANQGTNNPNEVLLNTTTGVLSVNYVFTLTANSCTYNQTIPLTVNPKPVLSSTLNAPTLCSGSTFHYAYAASLSSSPSFTWTRASVTGISSVASNGTNDPNEVLVNTTNQSVTVIYSYTVTDGITGCISLPQLVRVSVSPVPNISNISVNSCSGNIFTASSNNAPTGTLYTWTTPVSFSGAVVTGGSAITVGQFYVGQALSISGSSGVLDYTVTPSNNGCIGTNFHVYVTVTTAGTTAQLSNLSPPAICSGNVFNYSPASSSTVTTYAWARYFTNGITPSTNSGTGNPQEMLSNSSTSALIAYYAYTLTSPDGCTNTQQVPVTVNPVTSLSSTLSPLPVCSNTIFSYSPSSSTAATSFSWIRAAVAGISNAAGSGTNNPNELLINTTTSAINVSYVYTLTPPSGCVNTQTVIVSVSPAPFLSSTLSPPSICSGTSFTYTPTSSTNSITFSWSRAIVSSISNAVGSGVGNPVETLVNTVTSAVTVPYVYTLTANGCTNSQVVNVVVNPAPNIANQNTTSCSNSSFSVTPTNVPTGTQYTWSSPSLSPASSISGGSVQTTAQSSISQFLSNTTLNPATATYTVTPVANGCTGSIFTIAVNVNIITTLSSSLTPAAICSNTVFSYTPTSNTTGTTFSWTRSVVANISNPATSGTNNPNEILINITTLPVTVTYTYALNTPNGCVNTQSVLVVVNPSPILSSGVPAAICSGGIFNYTPTSASSNPVFIWSRQVISFISNGAGSGTNNPAEVLVNTSINAVTVLYTFTTTSSGCSNSQTVNVVVNPTPSIVSQTTSACNNVLFTAIPSNVPTGTQYTWTLPTYSPVGSISGGSAQIVAQNIISQTLNNTSLNAATASYTVTPVSNGCTGIPFILTVTVNTTTILSSSLTPAAICSNSIFNYTPTSNTTGTSFNWTRSVVNGISNSAASGINNPGEILINITTLPVTVSYTYALNTPNGCVNTQTIQVVVNPSPTLSSGVPTAICSGAVFNYIPTSVTTTAVFTWNRSVMTFISNGAGSGSNNPAEVLVNTSNSAVTVSYLYSIVANGCTNSQSVNVVVNPTPSISNQTVSACNSVLFTSTPSNVPIGTQYTWTLPTYSPVGSITGGTAQIVSQSNISQTLNNQSLNASSAIYTVTPGSNGCTGIPFILTVTVNTNTILSSSLTPSAICSNTVFNYIPASNTIGTSYSWTRAVTTGISNPAASGTNNPNETLINIITQAVSVSYTFSLNTPNGCVNTQTVTVLVNPSPILNSALNPTAICSGSVFNYTPTSITSGVTYSWNRAVIAFISNGAGAGSGNNNPSELLVNTSNNQVNVPYVYVLSSNGCINSQTVTVLVNPTPNVSNQVTTNCGGTLFSVSPSNVPSGTQYSWSLPSVNPSGSITGVSVQTIPQNTIGQILSNQTLNSAIATYTVTPIANGCTGVSFSVAITVKPAPVINNQSLANVCSGNAFSYTPINVPTNTTYTWSNPVIGPLNSLTGGNAQAINQTSISQLLSSTNNLTDTATYVVLPSTAGCLGNTFTLLVPISPVPVVNNLFDTICTGSAFTVLPAPVPVGTTYTWAVPTSLPFGRITGGKTQLTASSTISQTLVNTGNSIAQIVYSITPSAAGCAGSSFTLLETVGITLAQVSSKTVTICSGTLFDLTPNTTPLNTTYTWNTPVISPTGSVIGYSSKNTQQTLVSQLLTNIATVTGTVIYSVVPFNTGCSGNPFTATIKVSPVPKATITGKSVVCRDPYDTLTVSFVGTAPWSFTYTDNNVLNTQTGVTSSPFTWILPSLPVVPTRTLAISLVNDFACVDSINTSIFIQKVNPLPIGKIVSLHGNYICNNVSDTLLVSYSPLDTLSFQWKRNGINLPGLTSDSISTVLGGSYNAVLTDQNGCVDTASLPAFLTVIAKPVLNFSYDAYCINKLIRFRNLTDTTFIGSTQWLWDMGDSTSNNNFHATNTYGMAGNRHIKLTATQLYCQAYATSIDSTINIQFPISGIRMPSVSAYKGQYTLLAGRSLPGYRYLWTPTRGIDFPDSPLVKFNYQNTQEYLFNLLSPAGCTSFDTVLVRVFDDKMVDILVPKSFTPNNDGVNDLLLPYLAGIKTFQYFKIYNRFGKLLFESNNPDTGWNGSLNGIPQPMAIYIWVVSGTANDGTLVQKRGETLLLR